MLSLVLPTYNEAQNLPPLLDVLDAVLKDHPHEIIVVDDNSPDGTWRVAQMLAQMHPAVRVIRRIGQAGLSSAVVDGFDAALGDTLAVMDADGQHDTALLPVMVRAVASGADLVIGSRYMPGGSVGDWVRDRRIISRIGTYLCNRLSARPVTDPLSGFFVIRRSVYTALRPRLRPTGFKILLEILAAMPRTARVLEHPLIFRPRLQGESKLSLRVHVEFLLQVIRLSCRRLCAGFLPACVLFFWLLIACSFVFLVPRAWALRLLILDPQVRAQATTALQEIATREGWLLSDITLRSVASDHLGLLYAPHRRTSATPRPCTLTYVPPTLTCDAQ